MKKIWESKQWRREDARLIESILAVPPAIKMPEFQGPPPSDEVEDDEDEDYPEDYPDDYPLSIIDDEDVVDVTPPQGTHVAIDLEWEMTTITQPIEG